MKKNLLFLALLMVSYLTSAQIKAFSEGKRTARHFKSEELELSFSKSSYNFTGKESGFAGIIPTIVDAGFKLTKNLLDKRAKSFVAEYSKEQSNQNAFQEKNIPVLTFTRTLTDKDGNKAPGIEMVFKPHYDPSGRFYYYLDELTVVHSAARSTPRYNTLDYVVELKLTVLDRETRKTSESLAPITISSKTYNKPYTDDGSHKYRSAWMSAEQLAMTEAGIKIVETNPGKHRAEKILSYWNDHSDDIKTIVNNFLPKSESEGKEEQENTQKPGKGNEGTSNNGESNN